MFEECVSLRSSSGRTDLLHELAKDGEEKEDGKEPAERDAAR